MKQIVFSLSLLFLTACMPETKASQMPPTPATPEMTKMAWQVPANGSEAQFKRDIYGCKRENMQTGEYHSLGNRYLRYQSPPRPNWSMVHECMNLRGYRWVRDQ
jgi:hypothetical protein